MPTLLYKIKWRLNLIRKVINLVMFHNFDLKSTLSFALKEIFSTHRGVTDPVQSIGEDENINVYRIKDVVFHLPKDFSPSVMPLIYNEVFVRKIYEAGGCFVQPGDWVIDAGACEGFFSLYALSKGANVIAFEPVPDLAKALKLTLKPYIEEKRAIVLPFGLGDEVKEEPIVLDRLNAGASTFQDSNRKILPHQTETLKLKIETLDHLYEQGLISKVSFIKADIEGYERKLLKGASKLIKTFRPKLALCYYHLPDDFEVLRNIIESFQLGYRFALNNEVLFAWTKL